LRTALIDVYPADVEEQGLPAALGELVQRANTGGLEARLDVPADLQAPSHAAGLLYRVAQEALRNTIAHAAARHVSVTAGVDHHGYWLEMRDDGSGFDPEESAPYGHFGLRVARDMLADAGGRLTVDTAPGRGVVVRAELPAGDGESDT
jgi:signal transduction histidine kinase